jgi:threonine/homoserine/homoserine lactone efflux protein
LFDFDRRGKMLLSGFLVAAVVSEITPGPNMGYLAVLAASRGKRVGLAAVAGVALGLTLNGLAAALGLAGVVAAAPAVLEALRWGGALFLVYLAWDAWTTPAVGKPTEADLSRAFGRGLLNNMLNPKAAAFYLAVVPRFVDPAAPLLPQSLTLTALHVAVATAVHALIVLFAARFRALMSDPAREAPIRKALALVLGLVAVWFVIETGRA